VRTTLKTFDIPASYKIL